MEDDDLAFNFRMDQRKPESILRELRAKEHSLSAKVEKRLAMTYQMKAPWLPRLEQLVQLRRLGETSYSPPPPLPPSPSPLLLLLDMSNIVHFYHRFIWEASAFDSDSRYTAVICWSLANTRNTKAQYQQECVRHQGIEMKPDSNKASMWPLYWAYSALHLRSRFDAVSYHHIILFQTLSIPKIPLPFKGTYFYKSAKMIKEGTLYLRCNQLHVIYHLSVGIIHISDPPFRRGGDLMDCAVDIDRRLLDYVVGLDTELSELVGSFFPPPSSLNIFSWNPLNLVFCE